MNRMQETVLMFIAQSACFHSPNIVDNYSVECVGAGDAPIRLTGDLFYDIRNADTNEIIAVSDIPHDLGRIGEKRLPAGWELVRR